MSAHASHAATAQAPIQYRNALLAWYARRSFRSKLALLSTSICLICLLIASVALALNQVLTFRSATANQAMTLARITAANSVAAVSFEDSMAAAQLLDNLRSEPLVVMAQTFADGSSQGLDAPRLLANFVRDGGEDALSASAQTALPEDLDGYHFSEQGWLDAVAPIRQENLVFGYVHLRFDLSPLRAKVWRFAGLVLGMLICSLGLAWILASRLQNLITRPVGELTKMAAIVTRFKDYSVRAQVLAEDELGTLTHAVNAMLAEVQAHDAARALVESEITLLNEQLEQKVHQRTEELEGRNHQLQDAIGKLQSTQSQLVEAEKMAALGGLVAGVAHEINTPLGICVTLVSHLADRLKRLQKALDSGLRRSDLDAYVREADEALRMTEGNLRRASDLVRSFKLVAVDQSSEVRRRFRVREYLNEILLSLGPKLRKGAISVDIDCDERLELNSYPGVFAQIITNLVVNASIHAFPGEHTGTIRITCSLGDGRFELVFSDDGLGMPEEVRRRVFDPFFTTRRGEGGSGLGLHITYNQVIQTLGGSITCFSAPQSGTRFTIQCPSGD